MNDDLKTLVLEQGKALDAFMQRHEAALQAERRARDALEAKLNRNAFFSAPMRSGNAEAEFKALGTFAKTGDDAELKALAVSSNPDGGYLVHAQIADTIRTKVRDMSQMARLARRIPVASADAFEEPFDRGDMGAIWAAESASRPETTNSTFGNLRVPLEEIYVLQQLTQKLLDTTTYALGEWITERIADKFARAEGSAFVNGDGVGKPRGVTQYTVGTLGDSTRPENTIQYVPSGASGAFLTTTAAPDCLVDLVHSLRAPYTANAVWLMNRLTAAAVRKLKDQQGQFLWQPSMGAGMPDSLLGFPVYLDEEMPVPAANSLSIAFGDIQQAYTIAELPGIRMIRDPYSAKPFVQFYGYRRVGGGMADFDAVKFLRFSAS